jgi:DNA-binding CsgD family transcriptional regulator
MHTLLPGGQRDDVFAPPHSGHRTRVSLSEQDIADYESGRVSIAGLCERHSIRTPVIVADALRDVGVTVRRRPVYVCISAKDKAAYLADEVTLRDLEAKYGCSRWTLMRYLERKGSGNRHAHSGTPALAQREEVARFRSQGLTLREIGARLGVSAERVRQVLESNANYAVEQPPDTYVTAYTVAEKCGISIARVGRWAKKWKIGRLPTGSRPTVFSLDEANEFYRRWEEERRPKRADLSKLPPFGRLKAIRAEGKAPNNHVYWLCRCACGREKLVLDSNLVGGRTHSCGCTQYDRSVKWS